MDSEDPLACRTIGQIFDEAAAVASGDDEADPQAAWVKAIVSGLQAGESMRQEELRQ